MLSKTVMMRIPPDSFKKIKRYAEKAKLPCSTWIRVEILNRLDELEEKEKEGMGAPQRKPTPKHPQIAERGDPHD